jgi:protein-S-isoprenylcysteine O-methyltransferase Ste14
MPVRHLGIAIRANSAGLVATLAVGVALMAIAVAPREERYLTERSGADSLDHKASVRRWF